jgi:hypothetical protein
MADGGNDIDSHAGHLEGILEHIADHIGGAVLAPAPENVAVDHLEDEGSDHEQGSGGGDSHRDGAGERGKETQARKPNSSTNGTASATQAKCRSGDTAASGARRVMNASWKLTDSSIDMASISTASTSQ